MGQEPNNFDLAMKKYLEQLGLWQAFMQNRPPETLGFPEFYSIRTPFKELLEQERQKVNN